MGRRTSKRKYYKSTYTIRVFHYAPYIEKVHKTALKETLSNVHQLMESNPYEDYSFLNLDYYFLGIGNTLNTFLPMSIMYKNLIKDLDLSLLYTKTFKKILGKEKSLSYIQEREKELNTIAEVKMNKVLFHAREINSVNSTSFIISKKHEEQKRHSALAQISKDITNKEIENISFNINTTLSHKNSSMLLYNDSFKSFFERKISVTENDYEYLAQQILWPFTLLDIQRTLIAVFELPKFDLMTPGKKVLKPKTTRDKIIDYWAGANWGSLYGAVYGVKYGGWIGAIWGGVIGHIIGGWASYFTQ